MKKKKKTVKKKVRSVVSRWREAGLECGWPCLQGGRGGDQGLPWHTIHAFSFVYISWGLSKRLNSRCCLFIGFQVR